MDIIINALSTLSLIHWVVLAVVWVATTGFANVLFLHWMFDRQRNLYRSLKRPIVILRPINADGDTIPGGEMETEHRLLRANGFLNVDDSVIDYRTFDPTGRHCILVLGYKPGLVGLDDILNRVKVNHVPLIVYTYGNNAVGGEDRQRFDTYPYTIYANFPLTLLNHIFATAASYPYDRRKD